MGLGQKRGEEYSLTDEGRGFVECVVEGWADTEWTATAHGAEFSAGTYQTTTHVRTVDPEFRATVIARHDRTCPVSGVDDPGLLDVAHVLPWGEYPKYRADLANVLPLSKTHHAAFDREVFTIDREYRLQMNPSFETDSELLQRTILGRAGERISIPDESLDTGYVAQHNATLEWV